MKVCTKCSGEFPESKFYKNPNTRDKLESMCKSCHNLYAKNRLNTVGKRVQLVTLRNLYKKRREDGIPPRKPENLIGVKRPNVICRIIKTHHETTKGDPERLSSEFIRELLDGVK